MCDLVFLKLPDRHLHTGRQLVSFITSVPKVLSGERISTKIYPKYVLSYIESYMKIWEVRGKQPPASQGSFQNLSEVSVIVRPLTWGHFKMSDHSVDRSQKHLLWVFWNSNFWVFKFVQIHISLFPSVNVLPFNLLHTLQPDKVVFEIWLVRIRLCIPLPGPDGKNRRGIQII